jgi:hypothetical protein
MEMTATSAIEPTASAAFYDVVKVVSDELEFPQLKAWAQ